MLRCAISARFSSDLQRPSSIQDQIRRCRDRAKAHWQDRFFDRHQPAQDRAMRLEVAPLRTDPIAVEIADHGCHPAMRDGIDGPIVQPFEIEGLLGVVRHHRIDVAAARRFAADVDPAREPRAHWILSA